MSVTASDITISADGGAIPTVLVKPGGAPAPALVIVPSIFGPTGEVRDTARRFAEHGFLALVPDLFWRTDPGPFSRQNEAEKARAFARNKAFDRDAGVRDLTAVRDYALGLPESNGRWALVGYCFGGRYTLIAGADLGADAVAAFHPSKMGEELEAAARVTCPTSFHFGDSDKSVPMSEIEAVQQALARNPQAETYVYPGIDHGFTGTDAPAYDPEVTEQSFERAMTVLEKLKSREAVA